MIGVEPPVDDPGIEDGVRVVGHLARLLIEQRDSAATGEPPTTDALVAEPLHTGSVESERCVRELDGLGWSDWPPLAEPPEQPLGASRLDQPCVHRIVGRRQYRRTHTSSGRGRVRVISSAPRFALQIVTGDRPGLVLHRPDTPGTVFVDDPALLKSATFLYDALWSTIESGTRQGPPPDHLVGILSQLAGGATDRSAQRELGLSPRTYTRRAAELLDRLEAKSRFQAGIFAARRGWI